MAWIYCGAGMLFCGSGLYLFYRNVYEEGKSILLPSLIIIAGIVLIALGTAKYIWK